MVLVIVLFVLCLLLCVLLLLTVAANARLYSENESLLGCVADSDEKDHLRDLVRKMGVFNFDYAHRIGVISNYLRERNFYVRSGRRFVRVDFSDLPLIDEIED